MMEDDQMKWAVMHRRMKVMENAVVALHDSRMKWAEARLTLLKQAVKTLAELDGSSLEVAKAQLAQFAIFVLTEFQSAEPPAKDALGLLGFHLDQMQAEWDELYGSMKQGGGED